MSVEHWPAMPPEITRDGPYRVYKGGRYTVYDDGNSAETPYQTDRADAFEARLRDTAAALEALLDSAKFWAMQDRASREASGSMSEQDYKTWRALSYESTSWGTARAILTQLRTEGLI